MRLAVLDEARVDYLLVDLGYTRWLDDVDETPTGRARALADAWRRINAFEDVQSWHAQSVVQLVAHHPKRFELIVCDERGREGSVPSANGAVEVSCTTNALWRIR